MPDPEIQWHPGFFAGMEFEFKPYHVHFDKEYQLTRGPLQIDLLIIKKLTDEPINNEIGNIFRRHNIIEYKSPDDELSIDVFYKVQAYACLYKTSGDTVNEIPADDITVTLLRDTAPLKLLELLAESGSEIREAFPGIYFISGNCLFPTQIIVSGRLQGHSHSVLRILSRNAKREDIITFLQSTRQFTSKGDRDRADSVLQVSVTANYELYQKINKEDIAMCQALRELMKDDFDKAAFQGMQQGLQQGEISTTVQSIRNLKETLHLTTLQAMDALKVPESKREMIASLLDV